MSSDDRVDYGEPVGRDFFDKFLLSIIDAYPEPDSNKVSKVIAINRRAERLRAAREALLGQSSPEGRPPESDLAVLRWMGAEHYKDLARRTMAEFKGERPPKARSVRQLAIQAAERFGLPDNASERLRDKFRKQKEYWVEVEQVHDDVPETLDNKLLESVRELLARRGIEMNLSEVER